MSKKGFTLLEVLVVVIIIGILAAIALPQYLSTLEKARSAEALGQLGALRSSMERYWYEQIADGTYNVATLTNLDVDNPNLASNAKWTYAISDGNASGFPNTKSYFFTATRSGNTAYWVQLNQDGTLRKSTTLGGTGVSW